MIFKFNKHDVINGVGYFFNSYLYLTNNEIQIMLQNTETKLLLSICFITFIIKLQHLFLTLLVWIILSPQKNFPIALFTYTTFKNIWGPLNDPLGILKSLDCCRA